MSIVRSLFAAAALPAAAVALFAARGAGSPRVEFAPPLRDVRIEHPATWWAAQGYATMTSPVRPPTSEDQSTRIVVYLKVPEGARVSARRVGTPARTSLTFPPGTIADRVEYVGQGDIDAPPSDRWRVADVRGTTLGASSQEFHVYRPTGPGARDPLRGVAWPSDDDDAQQRATDTLASLLTSAALLGPRGAAAREASAKHLRSINGCADCHRAGRPPRTSVSQAELVNRGTDADGFFQPSTVFDDRAPLETYRPRNANWGDPFVRYVCGSDDTPAFVASDGGVTCAASDIPVGLLDVRNALVAGDAHARDLCNSRRYLYERLDEASQRLLEDAIEACGEKNE